MPDFSWYLHGSWQRQHVFFFSGKLTTGGFNMFQVLSYHLSSTRWHLFSTQWDDLTRFKPLGCWSLFEKGGWILAVLHDKSFRSTRTRTNRRKRRSWKTSTSWTKMVRLKNFGFWVLENGRKYRVPFVQWKPLILFRRWIWKVALKMIKLVIFHIRCEFIRLPIQ